MWASICAYNGLGLPVAKADSTGFYSYVCDGASPGSPVLSDGHTTFTAGLSSTVAGLTSFRHEDALGSLRFLTDGGAEWDEGRWAGGPRPYEMSV